jgi:hypothetical protein
VKSDDLFLTAIETQKIGPYTIQLRSQPKRRAGHIDFELFLRTRSGQVSHEPLIKGIYSRGNISWGNQGWIDIHYSDLADFGEKAPDILSDSGNCAEQAFRMMGKALPPGAMIFVSLITDIVWEVEIELHRITRESLSIRSLGIPPAATPIGRLLFMSGCRNIKSQAFDVQGSSRLAGEKALDSEIENRFSQLLRSQLLEYLMRPEKTEFLSLEKICRTNTEYILQQL